MQADKSKIIRLLKTIKGQIEGLIKMVEDDRYCIDISTQVLASQSLLKRVNLEILKAHFSHCVKKSFESGSEKEKDEKLEEMTNILEKLLKNS